MVSVGVKAGDYFTKNLELRERICKDLINSGIEIPYPQLDLRIRKDEKEE